MKKNLAKIIGCFIICVLVLTGCGRSDTKKTTMPTTDSSKKTYTNALIQKQETTSTNDTDKKSAAILLTDFSYKMNNACDEPGGEGIVEILYKSKPFAQVGTQNCPITTVHFFAVMNNNIFFTIEPSGIGGYLIYPTYFNIYTLNMEMRKITQISKSVNGIPGIYSKTKSIAYIYDNDDRKKFLQILDLKTNSAKTVPLDLDEQSQIGRVIFSPHGSKLAFEVGYGPANERGEIYIYDTQKQILKKTISQNKHIKIDAWKNENEILWSAWKWPE